MYRPVEKKKPYSYFDTPDGEDFLKKLWALLKPTTLVALGISTVDVMLYSHPQGYLKTLRRFVYISAPILGMTTGFVVATNMAAKLREKNDKINWFIGGATAGVVLGTWCKSSMGAFCGAFALGLAAVGKKAMVENNYTVTGIRNVDYYQKESGLWLYDWSLTKERPGGWLLKDPGLEIEKEPCEEDEDDEEDEEEEDEDDEDCDDDDEWEDEEIEEEQV